MKVGIIGLGLIGSSLALKITEAYNDIKIYGEDISEFLLPDVPSSGEFASTFIHNATHLIQFTSDYNINWNEEWNNMHNCYAVAYIYNTETLVIEHTEKHQISNE